jgi:recombination protein RecA
MAKKQEQQDIDDSNILTLAKDLSKEFKDDAVICTMESGQLGGEIPYWVPTSSTLLNAAIGGKGKGIPGGRIVEIHGKSSTGKSVLCYDIIAQAQKMGGVAMYIDTEGSAEQSFASVLGVNPKRLIAAQAHTVEELYNKAMSFVEKARARFGPDIPIVIIGDSVTPPTEDEMEKDMRESMKVGDSAKTQRRALRKLVNLISDEKAIFIGINHVTANIGGYIKETATGGSAWEYYPSLRIKLQSPMKISGEVKDSTIGIITKAYIAKSKLDRPFRSADIHLIYDRGLDDVTPTLEFVRQNSNLFGTSSGWYKLPDGGNYRMGEMLELMRTSPEAFEWLKNAATKMLQTGSSEGIEPYAGPKPNESDIAAIPEEEFFS